MSEAALLPACLICSRLRRSESGQIGTLEQQIAVAVDHGEQVIEVVGHAAGEKTDRFHLLGLLQELFGAGQSILGNRLFGLGAIEHEGQNPHQGHEQHDLADHQARDVQSHVARKQPAVDARTARAAREQAPSPAAACAPASRPR